MATSKPAADTAKKAPAAKRTATPRKAPKIIRNLRFVPVHLRFHSDQGTDPYRVQLAPRGQYGDIHKVPVSLVDSNTFADGYGVLFEIITETEARKIEYPQTGYAGPGGAEVIRPAETVKSVTPDWDGKGRVPARTTVQHNVGPNIVRMPGSEMTAPKIQSDSTRPNADTMIPDGVDTESRKVTVERAR